MTSALKIDDAFIGVIQRQEQQQIILEVAGQEKIVAHVLAAVVSQFFGKRRGLEQLLQPVSRSFNRAGEDAGVLVSDLEWNSADRAGDHRFAFPKPFGYREAEPFLQGFLQNHG